MLTILIKAYCVNVAVGVIHRIPTDKGGGERSSQMRTIAYKRGGGVQGYVPLQKNFFWTTKSQNFSFFAQKKLLHCHLLWCVEKCKPALSFKQKPKK